MRTKIIILAAVSAVMFLGCSKTEKNSEETYKEENISDKTDLNNLWFDFKSDMPEDRNVEDTLEIRQSLAFNAVAFWHIRKIG